MPLCMFWLLGYPDNIVIQL